MGAQALGCSASVSCLLPKPDARQVRESQSKGSITQTTGLPDVVTFDRDPRFVGETSQRESPSPFLRFWLCLGVQVAICPPRRPDLNGIVERYHRTFNEECLRVQHPADLEAVTRYSFGANNLLAVCTVS